MGSGGVRHTAAWMVVTRMRNLRLVACVVAGRGLLAVSDEVRENKVVAQMEVGMGVLEHTYHRRELVPAQRRDAIGDVLLHRLERV